MQDDTTHASGDSDEWYPWRSRAVSLLSQHLHVLTLLNNLTAGCHTRYHRKHPALGIFRTTNKHDLLVLEGKWVISDPISEDIAQTERHATQYVRYSHH
jgi:hypothetical protein